MITQRHTLQAVREIVFAALSGGVTYQTDTGTAYGTATLPAANVISRSVWLTGSDTVPDPLVAFNVQDLGDVGGRITYGDRDLRLRVWCVSKDENIATSLYESVRALFHFADQDAILTTDLSRPGGAYQLPAQIRQMKLVTSTPCDFDSATGRWYILATFRLTAI